ncbi:PRC-barrel domain-containing protein [Quadrisphaera granulorum]|uniref:PRC-barrel domain protein n=1 Tax=Quadrisphaera granulorum TaxID=317664 RepID=A0A316A5R1_9ACTN|nr:PRC-barrel domain-containing protein [Quadrisphaera granulorum]PWJ53025.1 PRC-barrel domain protein [Quadrisphaera granulorum]SZE97190.1 PRC-barrel domain-containing protein [Quadrisphaera granulorum]
MITDAEVERIPGAAVYGADGEKIGKAGAVYRDDQTGRPEWVTVQTGLFGTSESFVPLAQAEFHGDDLQVPFDKAKVKDAPRVDSEGHLDISEEDRLFEYYGVNNTGPADSAAYDARDDRNAQGFDRDRDRDHPGVAAAGAGAGLGTAAGRHEEGRDDFRDDRPAGYADDRPAGYADDPRNDRRDDDRGFVDKIKDKLDGDDARREGFRDDARRDDFRDDRGHGAGTAVAGGAAGAGLGGLAAAAASHRDERRDDVRDGYRGDHREDVRNDHRAGTDTTTARDDRFADGEDIGRRDDRSPSGLGSTPLAAGAGAAAGAAGGYAAGRSSSSTDTDRSTDTHRKPRLSQWVLVKREDIIEVPAEEAERLAAQKDGSTLR